MLSDVTSLSPLEMVSQAGWLAEFPQPINFVDSLEILSMMFLKAPIPFLKDNDLK